MNIELVPSAGYCYGVARAVRLARDNAPCYTLGPLIHNRRAVAELEAAEVTAIGTPDDLPEGAALLLRSHGAPPELYQELEERGIQYVDATCPDVAKIHTLVKTESDAGRTVLLFGDPNHPETKATAAWCHRCVVFNEVPDESVFSRSEPLTLAAQSTSNRADYEKICESLKKECTNLRILDTICRTTDLRQRETAQLSRRVDVMVVVGDRNSANTRHLASVCECPVILAEGISDIRLPAGVQRIGVAAGASTPSAIIEEVVTYMTEELKATEQMETEAPLFVPADAAEDPKDLPVSENEPVPELLSPETTVDLESASESIDPVPETDEPVPEIEIPEPAGEGGEPSFADLLEDSLRPIHNGDRVTGTVIGMSPTEIYIDLGGKQAAYIPIGEITDDPNANPSELCKLGDEIETYVVRVNDVEGTIMLSKRRLDTVKSWEDVEAAQDNRSVLEGVVVEENKGGVVVSIKGVRVFVPASQTGLPKDTPMSSIMKNTVRLRITEFNRTRRRVVGSIRSVSYEDRRSRSEAIWNDVEAGKGYQGVVKSLTSYGVFVDIGGVDGLVHMSELTWDRIKSPADFVKVGDPLEVTVISVDREKHRISLRHRKSGDDPWLKFIAVYKIGDVISVKVNKLMPFGAFAEIMPGVDGLIHISQITDHRINKPSDAISEGVVLDVKITDIDMDRKKISLSARALIETAPDPVKDDGPDEIVAIADETQTIVAEDLEDTEDLEADE